MKIANAYASHIESFDEARQRIDSKYAEIEQHLLEEFVKSERSNDCQRMKDLALILSNFKVRKSGNFTALIRYNPISNSVQISNSYNSYCVLGLRCMC